MEIKTRTLLVSAVVVVVAVVIRGGLGSEEMNTIRTTINSKAGMILIGRDKDSTVEGCQIVQEVEDDDVLYFRCNISELGLTENIWRSIWLCSK
jgi:hypothetical protein